MRRKQPSLLLGALLVGVLSSCGEEKGPPRKETYPVTGQVIVDGQPAENLAVKCHNLEGMDKEDPTVSSAFTDEEGKFELSTYESGDGVPPGEYVLTFFWGQRNMISMTYGGPDKLNGKYRDPEQSEFRITVENGEPTDLGRIELSTN